MFLNMANILEGAQWLSGELSLPGYQPMVRVYLKLNLNLLKPLSIFIIIRMKFKTT